MFLNIVLSNLHSIYNAALTVMFTTVLQKRSSTFPKRLGAATKEFKGRECVFQFESLFVDSVTADLL